MLHTAINLAGGKLDFPAALEAGSADDREAIEDCPADIMKHIAFVRDWAALEPKLSKVDLRPAVYLGTRDRPAARHGSADVAGGA